MRIEGRPWVLRVVATLMNLRSRASGIATGDQVRVRITHSGVCHSDVHCQEGHFDLGSAGKLPIAASGVQWPAVFGHEIVGTVVAAGPAMIHGAPRRRARAGPAGAPPCR